MLHANSSPFILSAFINICNLDHDFELHLELFSASTQRSQFVWKIIHQATLTLTLTWLSLLLCRLLLNPCLWLVDGDIVSSCINSQLPKVKASVSNLVLKRTHLWLCKTWHFLTRKELDTKVSFPLFFYSLLFPIIMLTLWTSLATRFAILALYLRTGVVPPLIARGQHLPDIMM